MNKQQLYKMMGNVVKVSNFVVFFSFLYVSWVLFKVGNWILASIILFSLAIYMLFNKVQAILDRGV